MTQQNDIMTVQFGQPTPARLNVTFAGSNGDLQDTVSYDATDEQIKTWATEAVRNGNVPGIPADPNASFLDFVVDRFPATGELPARLMVRPKTPFGMPKRLTWWTRPCGVHFLLSLPEGNNHVPKGLVYYNWDENAWQAPREVGGAARALLPGEWQIGDPITTLAFKSPVFSTSRARIEAAEAAMNVVSQAGLDPAITTFLGTFNGLLDEKERMCLIAYEGDVRKLFFDESSEQDAPR